MREVLSWIATTDEDEPAELLESCPSPGAQPALEALRSVWDADARFRSSLLQTVATALDPWQEPQIAAATIGDSQISADWLLDGPNTLYLISPADDQRRLRGLFVALVADITAGAFAHSARTGKPIDPALLLALDEVANIAPLPNLDEIASTGPGQGVQLLSVFQDISQAADRWGRERAETIFANHRARLFSSGIGDRATLEYLRHTLGEEEIARVSTHRQSALHTGLAHALERVPRACRPQPRAPAGPRQRAAHLRTSRARVAAAAPVVLDADAQRARRRPAHTRARLCVASPGRYAPSSDARCGGPDDRRTVAHAPWAALRQHTRGSWCDGRSSCRSPPTRGLLIAPDGVPALPDFRRRRRGFGPYGASLAVLGSAPPVGGGFGLRQTHHRHKE